MTIMMRRASTPVPTGWCTLGAMRRFEGWACVAFAVSLTVSTGVTAQRGHGAVDLATLARISRRVEEYYTRARTIVCTERVLLQPLRSDLLPDDRGRRLVYELRVDWQPPTSGETAGDAHIERRLLS